MIISAALFTLSALRSSQAGQPIEIREGLSIGGVSVGGRVPFAFDSVQQAIIGGAWHDPKEGDSLPTPSGGTSHWRKRSAGKDGSFGDLANGYLASSVDAQAEGPMLLEASSDGFVYVNGVPRAGDPYGYGYLEIPVWMHRGANSFLFGVGRGALKARLVAPRAEVQIETGDLTLPDVLIDGPRQLWAGVVLVNSTRQIQKVSIFARNSAGEAPMSSAEIPAMSIRKIPVKLSVPEGDLGKQQKFHLECVRGKLLDQQDITLEVKSAKQTHKETFTSGIDGSLQYYGVNPSQKPSNKDALVLSLHGASVEAIGQASAYGSKDWCTLVAATNRRPYGFDWEDIGRLDGLEVLELAKKRFPHEANHVHLTGHSMGGHGTWAIGTLYPDLFASIAPSAGWISFWSYAGGYQPANPTPVESMFLRSMSPSDTLARVRNTLEQKLYILHGDKDDNVPVDQARTMKKVLEGIHADFGYHEEPGAGHWWGSPCVDWPGIFDQIKATRIDPLNDIDFTTPSPAVSSHDRWVTILEQIHPLQISKVAIHGSAGVTENVQVLQLAKAFDGLELDGQKLDHIRAGMQLIRENGKWHVDHLRDGMRTPQLSGPFKNVFQNHFVFVVATHGTPQENEWAADKARYDAESFQYRGNGSVDIVTDSAYSPNWQRNVILYGNSDSNSAWKPLLGGSPIQVTRKSVKVGSKEMIDDRLGVVFAYPHHARGKWVMVGAISGTGLEGLRSGDRMALFTSGVAYPDWTVFSADVMMKGVKGVKGCGYFTNDWNLSSDDSAWGPD